MVLFCFRFFNHSRSCLVVLTYSGYCFRDTHYLTFLPSVFLIIILFIYFILYFKSLIHLGHSIFIYYHFGRMDIQRLLKFCFCFLDIYYIWLFYIYFIIFIYCSSQLITKLNYAITYFFNYYFIQCPYVFSVSLSRCYYFYYM